MPPDVAVIVTLTGVGTWPVMMLNETEVWPDGTITNVGTCAAKKELLLSTTSVPVMGAGDVRVTVPIALAPPVTCVGVTTRLDNCGVPVGFTVRVADWDKPPAGYVAVTVTVRAAATEVVEMAKVSDVCPTGMV